jgi:uncharacterized protein (TIGR04255 family)
MSLTHGTLELRKVAFELRFHPSLIFYNEMNNIGNELNEFYPDWLRNWNLIQFTDKNTNSFFLVSHNRIAGEMDAPDSFQAFKSRITKGTKIFRDKVPIDNINRIGVRFFWLCAVDFPFEELNRIIQNKFYGPREELSKALVSEFKDVAFFFDFEKANNNIHFVFGPVKDKEIPERIPPIKLITGEPKILETPNVGIFYDIDCYIQEIRISELESFLDKGYDLVKEMVNSVTKYILEA